jgi:hypothetical protein
MIATIEIYGVKRSVAPKNGELDSHEFCLEMFKLMLTAGFHKESLIDCLQEIINEEKKIRVKH